MKNKFYNSFVAAAVLLGAAGCQSNKKQMAQSDNETHGIELKYMDTTVSPRVDFYNYVNGTWMKENEIPADETRWGGFMVLRKETDMEMLEILKNAKESGKYGPETDQAKALMIYESQLDTEARNKAGVSPLLPALEKIEAMESVADFQKLMSVDMIEISQPFLGLSAMSNPSNSAVNAAYITPGRLGLPDRDFYTDTSETGKTIRKQYVDHITRML